MSELRPQALRVSRALLSIMSCDAAIFRKARKPCRSEEVVKRSALVRRFEKMWLGSNLGGFDETSFGEEV